MIVFDSSFDINVTDGADKIVPAPLNNGKFYLTEDCYNVHKTQIDALGISFETRAVLESEYITE